MISYAFRWADFFINTFNSFIQLSRFQIIYSCMPTQLSDCGKHLSVYWSFVFIQSNIKHLWWVDGINYWLAAFCERYSKSDSVLPAAKMLKCTSNHWVVFMLNIFLIANLLALWHRTQSMFKFKKDYLSDSSPMFKPWGIWILGG